MNQGTDNAKTPTSIADDFPQFITARIKEMRALRFPEEREWRESGLFYQRRQWLEYDSDKGIFKEIKLKKDKPIPMPVTNYLAKIVNANANALGARPVDFSAIPLDDTSESRRAAKYAELAKDAIDQETHMFTLQPRLAKHTALWGLGVMKDVIDIENGEREVPDFSESNSQMGYCHDCGASYQQEPDPTLGSTEPSEGAAPQQGIANLCPDCGSSNTEQYQNQDLSVIATQVVGKPKIVSKVVPVFSVLLPREIDEPNLSPIVGEHYRLTIERCKSVWKDFADKFVVSNSVEIADIAWVELQSLLGSRNLERSNMCWIDELWIKWQELPQEWQEVIQSERDPQEVVKMMKYGLYGIQHNGTLLEFGANYIVDPDTNECWHPYTFYEWEKDPANVYPKGIAEDLKPLQKKLNRLDSLVELAIMANAAGKWLIPTTQRNMRLPSGVPTDVVEFDTIGDGKVAPSFVAPTPIHGAVWQQREQIIQDMNEIGNNPSIEGGAAQGDQAFRTVAFLGAKAEESRTTQRSLWENAHRIRYQKLLALAKTWWDEERKSKIAGNSGKLFFASVTNEQLRGLYTIELGEGSSRPRTPEEKQQLFQGMIQLGVIDITDAATRKYIAEETGIDVALADKLHYDKAERDLEGAKQGNPPIDSPYQKWDIFFKVFSDFTLTEEFEDLPDAQKLVVMSATEHYQQMLQEEMMQQVMAQAATGAVTGQQPGVPTGGKPGAPGGGKMPGKGKPQNPDNAVLQKVPGQTAPVGEVQSAAQDQGNEIAGSIK